MDLMEQGEYHSSFPSPSDRSEEENEALCEALEVFFKGLVGAKERQPDFPVEVSHLLRAVVGSNRLIAAVNAGDGSIIQAFDAGYSFGFEEKQGRARLRQGSYTPMVGDFNRLPRLMEPLEISDVVYDLVVVLSDEGAPAPLTHQFVKDALPWHDEDSYRIYVDKGSKHTAELRELPGLFCVVVLADTRIYFTATPDHHRVAVDEVPVKEATVDLLDLLGPWVEEQRSQAQTGYYYRRRGNNTYSARAYIDRFKAVTREYGRRFLRQEKSFDIELVAGKLVNFLPSDFCRMALEAQGYGDMSARIHKRDIVFFAQNSGLYDELMRLEDKGVLVIDPLFHEAVGPIVSTAKQATTPYKPLTPAERIAYLGEVPEVKCLLDDEDKGFRKGRWYRVALRPVDSYRYFSKSENVKGVVKLVDKRRMYRAQEITIDNRHRFNDADPEHIRYILKHFDVPDPGDVATRYPELYGEMRELVSKIEAEYLSPRGYKLKSYQLDDAARLATKDRGILAWQQGLGKSLGGLLFMLVMLEKMRQTGGPGLVIAPQDLIPQWQREAKKFFGIELHWIGRHKGGQPVEVKTKDGPVNVAGGAIRNIIEAREIDKRIRQGGGGFYITHFEALTSGGAKNLRRVEEPFVIRTYEDSVFIEGHYDSDGNWVPRAYETKTVEVWSNEECPSCGKPWDGILCKHRVRLHEKDPKTRECGYTSLEYRLPTIGRILSTTFKDGVIVVDEGTQIASSRNSTEADTSQKTKAVCGLRAKSRLVMSGTPVKNFLAQAFWLMWFAIGDNSDRFPYSYAGGKKKFAQDFVVLEWTKNEETGNWFKQREVGEVTNVSQLRKQFASVLLRRVKEQTGELIVQKKVHVIHAPLGYYQREQLDFWLQHFPDLFAEKYPNDPKVKRGTHRSMAAMLGMDHKLNYGSVMPQADPDWEWTGVNVSNYTPAALKALETTMALVKQGRRVLVGTDVVKASGWLAARLAEKGVATSSLLKRDGQTTLDPADRSKVVEQFQDGSIVVLSSTQKAIRLGHNLDQGGAVVLLGLDWDYETFAQFTERVHRLTSKNPIDIYVILPGDEAQTIVARKWDVIQDKAKGAALAIDGEIPEEPDEPIDIKAIVRELMEKGIQATGNEVLESKVREAWDNVPHINDYVIPESFALDQAKPWIIDWAAANTALDEHLREVAAMDALHEEALFANYLRGKVQYDEPIGPLTMEEAGVGVCRDCNTVYSEFGDGYDGFCPDCADKRFNEPEGDEEREAEGLPPIDHEPVPVARDDEPEQIHAVPDPEPEPTPVVQASMLPDLIQSLKDVAELHKLGILDEDEFKQAKAALIAQMTPSAQAVTPGDSIAA